MNCFKYYQAKSYLIIIFILFSVIKIQAQVDSQKFLEKENKDMSDKSKIFP